MRRPINWFVFALSLGFLAMGRYMQSQTPTPGVVVERTQIAPQVAIAVPAALRTPRELEFGYIDRDR